MYVKGLNEEELCIPLHKIGVAAGGTAQQLLELEGIRLHLSYSRPAFMNPTVRFLDSVTYNSLTEAGVRKFSSEHSYSKPWFLKQEKSDHKFMKIHRRMQQII